MKVRHLVAVVSILGSAGFARAATNASDNASNYAGISDFNGTNEGTGFGTWSVSSKTTRVDPGTDENYGGSSVHSTSNAGDNNPALDVYSAANVQVDAYRPLTGGPPLAGQSIVFGNDVITYNYNGSEVATPAMGNTAAMASSDGIPGSSGVELADASGHSLVSVFVDGGGDNYFVTDANGTTAFSNVHYNYYSALTFDFTLGANGAYTVVATGSAADGGSATFNGDLSTATGGVAEADFFEHNGGDGSDAQIESLAVTGTGTAVPEPASLSLLTLAGAGLLGRRRRA